ncbi:MAG: GNAT family N-acetyltransferase [Chloroflexi bacterium]|nr:GNAT family N-acetyltransferase [Chloroflexota bacterium]
MTLHTAGPTADFPQDDEITYRRARTEDAERTYEIVQEAQGALDRRQGRESHPALPAERIIRFRHFCVRYDGDRFWVAEAGGRMVAAAYATLRDDAWYLDALHVLPEYQSRKIGSELIRRCLAGTGPSTALTVLTAASNPVSNGLYLRFGMLPQDSTLSFDGPIGERTAVPGQDAPPLTGRPIDLERDQATLAAFDLATVAFARPTDHEFWTGVPGLHHRILERDGSARGYAYVSSAGAIGPIAVARPEDLVPALDLAADIAAEAGAQVLHIRNFGSARAAVDWSTRRGLRLSDIGLMLSSRPVGQFGGYVTSGADALY